MIKATATYQGRKIEARQGEDGLYRAYIKGLAKFDFEPMEGVQPSRYARKVVNWAVKAIQEAEHERLKGMDFKYLHVADSIAFYSDQEIKDWFNRFIDAPAEVLIISDIPFSYTEIRDEILRRDRMKGALEE